MDAPLCGLALISHNEVSDTDLLTSVPWRWAGASGAGRRRWPRLHLHAPLGRWHHGHQALTARSVIQKISHPSAYGSTIWDCGPKVFWFSTRFEQTVSRAFES